MVLRALAGFIALVSLLGCSDDRGSGSASTSLVAPSTQSGWSTGASTEGTARANVASDVMVSMQDACDPETFNAALGAGTCVRNGGISFQDFIALLTKLGSVGAWHFSPRTVNARTGETFLVMNRGGEVHTFTEVEDFGGGIVENLNTLAHLPTVAPECMALDPDDFVSPGQVYHEEIEEAGIEKYQCCIHPWMRLEAHVTEAHTHP
jgi:hypothetical protein